MSDSTRTAQSGEMQFDWDLRFVRPATALACEYWESRRLGRQMPTRADLSPSGMRKFTENVGLIEVRREPDGQLDFFIRRAGVHWESVFGPITGKVIHEFAPPEIETRWREVFLAVHKAVLPVRVTTDIRFQRKSWLRAELFVGPLGEEEVSMLLLCFSSWSLNASPGSGG